ncbi:MAG: alpha/beta hydrolase [Bacteroidales bacterium]|nr:alpha/beta hydrolase [Bacteroidales bacterium]
MTKKHLSLFLLLLLYGLSTMAQNSPETHVFATREGWGDLRLDLYKPTNPRPDSACVIAVFGGGFVNGSRYNDLQTRIAATLTERGFAVVNIDYRLGLKDSQMVAQNSSLFKLHGLFQYCIDIAVEDCSDAVAYVVAHADQMGISPRKMVLVGSSAGAITVLQTDYCRANSLPSAATLPQGWKPLAVASYAGAIQCGNSKLHYATSPSPTLFCHGTKDKIVAYKKLQSSISTSLFGSVKIAREFERKGYPYWFMRYEGIGHEVASFLPGSVEIFCAFVDQVCAGKVKSLDATLTDAFLVPTEWTKMNLFDLYKH